jgi:hypothetical protein
VEGLRWLEDFHHSEGHKGTADSVPPGKFLGRWTIHLKPLMDELAAKGLFPVSIELVDKEPN